MKLSVLQLLALTLLSAAPAFADDSAGQPQSVAVSSSEVAANVNSASPAGGLATASPILVKRNSVVRMEFRFGRLLILAEGRALSQGRLGEIIKVMNMTSKTIVTGRVAGDSMVEIQ